MKKCFFSIFVILCIFTTAVSANVPYDSYNYTTRMGKLTQVPCPAPFIPLREYNSITLNETLKAPEDIFLADNGDIYIADSIENKVIITDEQWKIKRVIRGFDNSGKQDRFSGIEGIFVCNDGDLYIADTGNSRIVILDKNDKLIKLISKPNSDIFDKNYVFKPAKVSVDASKHVFVVARGEFNGIMQFDDNGVFLGFLGSNTVNPSPFELFWKRIMTKQQRSTMKQFIPLEYSNITIDNTGFLYVVTGVINERVKVKKLSPDGQNILTTSSNMPVILANSNITAICVDEFENYYFIDNANGNISAFNKDGNMLYAFGGFGNQLGTFKSPTSIKIRNNYLFVTDKVNSNITVFNMSEYAKMIRDAYNAYIKGDYENSMDLWKESLKLNGNFELAYVQLGRIYYKNGLYPEAMEYFKLGNYKGENYISGYGKAFAEYRGEFLKNNLSKILTGTLIAIIIVFFAYLYIQKKARCKKC